MQRLLIVLLIAVIAVSCNREEQCPSEDFTGTYMGDANCILGLTDQDDLQVVVSKKDEKTLEIDFRGNVMEVDIKGCELDVDGNISLGTGYDGSAVISEGVLTLTYQMKVAGILTEECDFVGEKI